MALVAAKQRKLRKRRLDLIDVEYESLPAVFDMDAALQAGAPLLYEELGNNILPGGTSFTAPRA